MYVLDTDHVTLVPRHGAESVDEQPISLEDALIAHVGRQGDKSFLLR